MGKKRRKDEHFKVGESMPGTVGDSQGTYDDNSGSPMDNINNRRYGELVSFDSEQEKTRHEQDQEKGDHQPNQQSKSTAQKEWENKAANGPYDSQEDNEQALKSAEKFGHHWAETKQRKFLAAWDLSPQEMGWEDLVVEPSHQYQKE